MYQRANSRMRPRRARGGGCLNVRVLMGLGMIVFSLISYYGSASENPITGEKQYVSVSVDQEIGIGLQAAPNMMAQFGGLHPDQEAQDFIDYVGYQLVDNGFARYSEYQFEFHLLADEKIVNAFALPGGQIFMTAALLGKLETEDQVAGVLAHEIIHVIGRHGAEQMAQSQLMQGISGAVVMASYDPNNPGAMGAGQMALMIGQLVSMKFGRSAEIESDVSGVCLMYTANYDPESMVRVMEILDEASSGGRPPEFMSTHPDPGNRIDNIWQAIDDGPSACP